MNWAQALGITPPDLAAVAGHREANTFVLLLVALLERDQPMTLMDVAERFEEAGLAHRARALEALKRCRPARPPVHREGDLYHLDPHDEELDSWVFRLGLRPARVAPVAPRAMEPVALPGPETPLTLAELDDAWKGASLYSWSALRLVVSVLDAHGEPMSPAEVVAAVSKRTTTAMLTVRADYRHRGSPIDVLPDGRWTLAAEPGDHLKKARMAVRERVAAVRQREAMRPDPADLERRRIEFEQERAAQVAGVANLSRALLVAFPSARPQAVAVLDVGAHQVTTFVGEELAGLPSRLAAYDVLGAVDVRGLLRALDIHPGERRLAELGPPQKTKKLNKSGRLLKITTALLVQGSCGISKPFGDEKKLAEYLAKGDHLKLRRRLEADAHALHALYEFGLLHGAVRLRWGFIDEFIPAPWAHRDEPRLYDLKKSALATNTPLEVVVGTAPGWSEPWSRSRLAHVEQDASGWRTWLVDERGVRIDETEVQRARPLEASMLGEG